MDRFKKIISGKIENITIAAGMVGFFSLISRLIGIFRDRVLASHYGAGDVLDAYYAAFKIPDFIYSLLIAGALSAGFIPVFSSLIEKDKKEQWKFASNVLNVFLVIASAVALFALIFTPQLMCIIAPGFEGEKLETAISMTRIMIFSPLLLGLSGILGGVLQSYKRFFSFSIAPVFYNLGIIIGAVYLTKYFGNIGLAYGVVFGASLHLLSQLPVFFSLKFKYKFGFNFKDALLIKTAKMTVPRIMGLAATNLNLLFVTMIATTLAPGTLSIFNFATNLEYFPIGIFALSYAVAAFPTFAENAFKKDELIKHFSLVVRQILFFIIPSAVLLIALRAQIVRVVLGAGAFGWEDTVLTMNTLAYFSYSLFAQSLIPLLARVFYARHDSKTPFYAGLTADALGLILSFWFGRHLGVIGLAIAFSISQTVYLGILWLLLKNELEGLDEKRISISAAKFVIAGLAAAGAIQAGKLFIHPAANMETTFGVFTQGLFSAILGISTYLIVCYILKSEELNNFIGGIKRRVEWRKEKVTENMDL